MAAEIEAKPVALDGAREAPDVVARLEDDGGDAAPRELVRRRQPGRARAEDRDRAVPGAGIRVP